ncbi:hypothetical protein ASG76_00705 [Nocardioides sp. Soil774]|nr:hypothetical protein ASG76_00705 [Nocardioides sp. Soil774]
MRATCGLALAAWIVVLAVTLLSPSAAGPTLLVETTSHILARAGVPESLTAASRVEFGLNVAAFVPVSLLGIPVWPRLSWRDWTATGFVASFFVEVVQAVWLDGRSATNTDVVANTLGTLVGAALGVVLLALLPARGSEDGADLPHRNSSAEQF